MLPDDWDFKHFKPEEFTCKCEDLCEHEDLISRELVAGLDALRGAVDKPFRVTSGVRCEGHNDMVGGTATSQHKRFRAADIMVPFGMTPGELAEAGEMISVFAEGGIGIYNSFVHFDVRGTKARWDSRS